MNYWTSPFELLGILIYTNQIGKMGKHFSFYILFADKSKKKKYKTEL